MAVRSILRTQVVSLRPLLRGATNIAAERVPNSGHVPDVAEGGAIPPRPSYFYPARPRQVTSLLEEPSGLLNTPARGV